MSDVRVSGPLFDGRAEIALMEGVDAIRRQVAERGVNIVRANFASSIRVEETGRALAAITTADHSTAYTTTSSSGKSYTLPVYVGTDEEVVTTDLATYGPWLEGVGSRNATTRFKGYHGFRRGAEQLDAESGRVGDDAIRPYVERMS